MRWKSLGGAVALFLALTAGCKQRCFVTEADLGSVQTSVIGAVDLKPELAAGPLIPPVDAPPTLHNLDRKVRFISLAECIATALEQGTVGQPSLLFPGTALDNLVQFTGRGVSGSDAIRVFALDPARTGADIDAALSKFDAVFSTSVQWQTTDQPIATPLQSFQTGGSGVSAISQQDFTGTMRLLKPLATGGVAGITYTLPYQYTNLPARVNPSYRPSLQFSFEQPLLQGFGVEINQLRAANPTSVLNPGVLPTSTAQEGILVSRIRFDQSRAEFERQVNQMLLNVEVAYWNLYGSYWALYSREQGLRFAYQAYKKTKVEYEVGKSDVANFSQARGQYEQFRAQRLQAIDTVLDNERQLRALMGLPIEDGCRLMPSDSPTLAPYEPNWQCALEEALTKRPELYMARQDVKVAQLNLILARNQLLPDLRVTSSYDFNAIGARLDGADGTNANRNLADGNFSNWTIGLQGSVPLGFRFANAQVRQAKIGLARSMEVLIDQERKAQRFLGLYYRRITSNYEQIRANRAQREAFATQLLVRQQKYLAGGVDQTTLDRLLEAQRFWADALAQEYQQIVAYQNALAGFEYAKGTITQHNNVVIAEGALPNCAQVRAVENARKRTDALILRERAAPVDITPNSGNGPMTTAASLPAVMAATPPLKDAPALPVTPTPGATLPAPTEIKQDELFLQARPGATTKPDTLPAGLMRRPTEFGAGRK